MPRTIVVVVLSPFARAFLFHKFVSRTNKSSLDMWLSDPRSIREKVGRLRFDRCRKYAYVKSVDDWESRVIFCVRASRISRRLFVKEVFIGSLTCRTWFSSTKLVRGSRISRGETLKSFMKFDVVWVVFNFPLKEGNWAWYWLWKLHIHDTYLSFENRDSESDLKFEFLNESVKAIVNSKWYFK